MSSLSQYGKDFEYKVLSCMLEPSTSHSFMNSISNILDHTYFSTKSLQSISKIIHTNFLKYNSVPTLQVFKIEWTSPQYDDVREDIKSDLKIIVKNRTASDSEYIQDKFIDFCRRKSVLNAMVEAHDLLETGDFKRVQSTLMKSFANTEKIDPGFNFTEEIDKLFDGDLRVNISSTGLKVIDDITAGGAGGGDLITFIANSGMGKCVGPDTVLHIKYMMYMIDDVEVPDWEYRRVSMELNKWDRYTSTRTVEEYVKIGDLFESMKIPAIAGSRLTSKHVKIKVETPFGWKKISSLFRTHPEKKAVVKFKNGTVLNCSHDHKIFVSQQWVKVKDICTKLLHVVHCHNGEYTEVDTIDLYDEYEIFYDISVQEVHCYYSSGILSHNSWLLQNVGLQGILNGKTVVHFTCELNERYTGLRYSSLLIKKSASDIQYNEELVKSTVKEMVTGKLMIKYFPSNSTSVLAVENYLNYLILMGIKPSMIIVDYADLLLPAVSGANSNSYQESGSIYEDLRSLSGKLNVPVFTASQANRGSLTKDVVTADDISESYKKIHISDIIISLARTEKHFTSNTGSFYIIKNRYGPSNISFLGRIDYERGLLDAVAIKSDEEKKISEEINNGKTERFGRLSAKFEQFTERKKLSQNNDEVSDMILDELGIS